MKFLFYISKKYSIPIIEPLIKFILSTDHQFGLYVSQKVRKELPESWLKYDVFSDVKSAKEFNSDFVLVPGNFVDFRIPGIKVQLFHGLGVEKSSHYKIRHFFDVYCTSGPFVTKRFWQLKKKHGYFEVLETGWTKVDHILNYTTTDLKLNIPKDKKIILFAPTHSSKMQSATELMSTIPKIIKENEIWLIKFHELMNKELIQSFKNNLKADVMFIEDYDITPFLHAADVLISDTSSVLYEFMLLDKPVITYNTKSRYDKGMNIQDPDVLGDAIDWSLKNPKEHSRQRKAHLEEINPHLDGRISEHLISKLIEGRERFSKIKKPLNLFRKLQLLYHSRYKKGYLR